MLWGFFGLAVTDNCDREGKGRGEREIERERKRERSSDETKNVLKM